MTVSSENGNSTKCFNILIDMAAIFLSRGLVDVYIDVCDGNSEVQEIDMSSDELVNDEADGGI